MPDNIVSSEDDTEKHLLTEGTSFRHDSYLYRVLLPGQDFLEYDGFSTYAETADRIRSSGKKVVLSIGESSTSGWDTTITPINRERKAKDLLPISAFFRYKNFTDLLRDKIGDDYEVLNAGIPGHSVLSGVRRLNQLQSRFKRDGISVNFVVIHFGNNDCLWEGNLQDRVHLMKHIRSPIFFEHIRRYFHPIRSDRIVLRTNSAADFGKYNKQLIRLARKIGAPPIIVQPEIPIYWKPGSRYVDYDFDQIALLAGGAFALAELDKARKLWESAIELPYSPNKIKQLKAAVEHDFIIPRIKHDYVAELQRVARDTKTPLIQTPIPRNEDEKIYFLDYCHPRKIINTRIADQISTHISALEKS